MTHETWSKPVAGQECHVALLRLTPAFKALYEDHFSDVSSAVFTLLSFVLWFFSSGILP